MYPELDVTVVASGSLVDEIYDEFPYLIIDQ